LRRFSKDAIGPVLREKIPFFMLTIAAMLVAITAQSTAIVTLEAHPWPARIAQACYGLVFYVRATFLATSWYPLYEIPFPLDPFEWRFLVSALLVVTVTILLIWRRRRWPAALVIWICYGALLGPVLGLAQSGNQLVADRYSYLSCLGFAVLLGWLFARCWLAAKAGGLGRPLCTLAVVVLLAAWTLLARQQTHIWHDEQILWEHNLEYGPSAMAYNNLGVLQSRAANPVEAVPLFSESLEVAPSYTMALDNLLPDLEAAIDDLPAETLRQVAENLRASMALHPNKSTGWYVLGLTMMKLKAYARAAGDFEKALKADANLAPAWYQMGLTLQLRGRNREALEYYRRALELDPQLGDAWLALGIGLIENGDLVAGGPVFEKAVALKPENSLAWTGLGACRMQGGDRAGAVSALERAIALEPGNRRAAAMLEQLRLK
jgi:Tfp pilus assembly protein PilF